MDEAPKAGLLSLPLELLRDIAYELASLGSGRFCPWWHWSTYLHCETDQEAGRRREIANFRLVCKRLYDAGSHLLVPCLKIRLNNASLESAKALAEIPQIAAGVLYVELILNYCPENVANNLELYSSIKKDTVYELYRDCDLFYSSFRRIWETESPEREALIAESNAYERAEERWEQIDHVLRQHNGVPQVDAAADPFMSLRTEGFRRFQALHSEQEALIQTESFATLLSSIMQQLPSVWRLEIIDNAPSFGRDDCGNALDEAATLNDDAKLLNVLSYPLPWGSRTVRIQGDRHTPSVYDYAHTAVAALLCDIPVALARANVRLRNLLISCYPLSQDMHLLDPAQGALKGTEDELRLAMSALESFVIRLGRERNPSKDDEQFSEEAHNLFANYLAICQSSEKLTRVYIELPNGLERHEQPPKGGSGY